MRRLRSPLGIGVIALAGAALAFRAEPRAAEAPAAVVDSIASPAAAGSAEPNLAVAGNRVWMTWLEPADSGHALKVARLNGRRWSAPTTIRSGRDFFVNWADFPSVVALDGGRLAAHWLQRNGKGTYAYGVRVSQSADGGRTWSRPVTPHRDSSQTEHGFVAMWRDRGGLGAVWLDGRKFVKDGHDASNEMMLVTTTIDTRGRLGPEVRLDERTCDCCQNSAAMSSAGPIVAYRNRTSDEIRDIYITRRVAGVWTRGEPLHSDNWKIAACPVNGPAVDATMRRVVVAWFTAANDSARVKVAFSDDAGVTFASPLRVDDGNPAGRVDVKLTSDGGALVSWIERTGGDTAAVRVRRVGPNGRLGQTTTIASSSATRASGFPRMVVIGSDVVFAWTVPGRPSSIRVARAPVAELR